MSGNKFIRQCKSCNKTLIYKTFRTFDQAEKKNSLCKSCGNNLWKKNHPNTKCYVCKKAIYRIPSRSKNIIFCTYICRNKYYSKEKSFAWKGGEKATKNNNRLRRIKNKLMAVQKLGGKCVDCGYCSCLAVLEFHHLNPRTKDRVLRSIANASWKKTNREIKKCILLCSNCHRERHYQQPDNIKFYEKAKKEIENEKKITKKGEII
jgi:hypothetical protein